MILGDACKLLEAEVIWGEACLGRELQTACGADLMSDVLAYAKEKTLLLTGLTNIQAVRTAEISDLAGIVFVRGKRPEQDLIRLAAAKGIPLLATELPMFESCGILFKNGVKGCAKRVVPGEP
ncbi:MAG: DRTGG domain-containing protein [Sporomusaceae bacterium]|nr:DRTGG domain-containing protein [Sporomusaceae bacterium]